MRTVRTLHLNISALTLMAILVIGCDDSEQKNVALGDYMPLDNGVEWKYSRSLINPGIDPVAHDELNWKVDGDTVIEGKTYTRIADQNSGFVTKVVRKEGSKYFGRNHEMYGGFTHEYVFLDTEVTEGNSWHYFKFDGAIKTEYIVKSVNASRTVNGKTYSDVLELEVNYYEQVNAGEYKFTCSVVHAYAKDVGEIYSYYPYPLSGFFADLSTELISINR